MVCWMLVPSHLSSLQSPGPTNNRAVADAVILYNLLATLTEVQSSIPLGAGELSGGGKLTTANVGQVLRDTILDLLNQ